MDNSTEPIEINGEKYTVGAVFSDTASVPFPVKVIDLLEASEVTAPHEHIGIRQQARAEQLMSSMNETGIWNVVQFTQDDVDQRIEVACRVIQNPKEFLDNPGVQILKANRAKGKAKRPEALNEKRWSFRASAQKYSILEAVDNHVMNLAGAKGIAASVRAVGDELFTNAIYNAPFGDTSYTLDRGTTVFLDPELSAEMLLANNDRYLLIGCIDRFGSLDCEKFIKRTAKTFELDIGTVLNRGIGGAGIGMIRIIELVPDVFIVVEKEKRTFVGCRFPLNTSQRKVREASRNFFLAAFKEIVSENSGLRVEMRGTAISVHCSGILDENTPFKDLELVGASEIAFDMRLVKGIVGESCLHFLSTLKNFSALKKVYLDYVPITVWPALQPLLNQLPVLIEIRSLYGLVNCSGCKTKQSVVLKKNVVASETAKRGVNGCVDCGAQL